MVQTEPARELFSYRARSSLHSRICFNRTRSTDVKIARPAPIKPRRALLHIVPAGIFGYVSLMLMTLSSPAALAQVVTLQPGEYNRVIRVAPGSTHDVELRSPGHICGWPSLDQVRNRIPRVETATLEQAESFGMATGNAMRDALNMLLALGPGNRISHYTGFVQRNQRLDSGQTELTVLFSRQCLGLDEARSALFQIRQVIRAHLGLPAPSSPPSATGNIR